MIELLASTPRETGAGTYVAHLAGGFAGESEVYFRRRMSPAEYDRTSGAPGGGLDAPDYLRAKIALWRDAERTHVTSEGFGPVFGRRTALVTVHQVLDARAAPPNDFAARLRYLAIRRAYRALVRLGTPVVTDSASTREAFVRRWGADRGRVEAIPNAVDTSFFAPGDRLEARRRRGTPLEAFLILHVSSDDARKNVKTVLATWSHLRSRIPRAILVHLGPSPAVREYLRTSGDPRCVYRSRVDPSELLDWYRAADILFHPSRLEGFSYPVFEALACGTPALVSDLDVFREELGPHLRARAPKDVAGFVGDLSALSTGASLPDPQELRRWVVAHYSLPSFVARFQALYRSLGLRC